MDKLLNINPIILAFIATMFTYFMNLLGFYNYGYDLVDLKFLIYYNQLANL